MPGGVPSTPVPIGVSYPVRVMGLFGRKKDGGRAGGSGAASESEAKIQPEILHEVDAVGEYALRFFDGGAYDETAPFNVADYLGMAGGKKAHILRDLDRVCPPGADEVRVAGVFFILHELHGSNSLNDRVIPILERRGCSKLDWPPYLLHHAAENAQGSE